LAFASSAVLASLADTLMPDAHREGGGLIAFATAAGFFLVRDRERLSSGTRKVLARAGHQARGKSLTPEATI
jgi:hypothetical protein